MTSLPPSSDGNPLLAIKAPRPQSRALFCEIFKSPVLGLWCRIHHDHAVSMTECRTHQVNKA